jgi:hypothetical protein
VVLQSGTGDVHPWFAALPDEWRASEPEAVDYVVCAPPIDADNTETQQARTCEFMVTGDGGRDFQGMRDIPVYLRTVHTLVLDPVSGDALGELVVSGSAPARDILNGGVGCPITIGGDELEGIYGEYPTAGNFQAAFRGQFLSE